MRRSRNRRTQSNSGAHTEVTHDDWVLWDGASPNLGNWSATASDGSSARLSLEPGPHATALRFDFELAGARSWAIARRRVDVELPPHYVAVLRLRGAAPPNELQLKLVDASGANVWWWRLHDFAPSPELVRHVLRKARLGFAWGPLSGGEPTSLGAIELAVAAGPGGPGTLFIEELRIEPRAPTTALPLAPAVRASSSLPSHEPERALEADERTSWRPDPNDTRPWLEVDFGTSCEFGGVAVDFEGPDAAPACRLLGSEDGEHWAILAEADEGTGERRWLRTEAESRFARLELVGGSARGIARLQLVPLELAASPVRHAAVLARAAQRGAYPRHLLGEQAYWAVVGADGDERKGLLGEDGALEIDAEAFSLEPFLWVDGQLVSWADVQSRAWLEEDDLPIPSVGWEVAGLRLRITAFAVGPPGASALVARYEVEHAGASPRHARLLLAIRPFQVTPAWQSLNLAGGVAPIVRIERTGRAVCVNGARQVIAVSQPDAFGAARSEEGPLARFLSEGRTPPRERVLDPLGFVEGVLAFDLALRPGVRETIAVAVPLHAATPAPPASLRRVEAAAWVEKRLAETTTWWRSRLAQVPVELPPAGARYQATLRASVAWILVNREGPRIQPGPRSYRRSWIRDGSLTATALAELGFAEEARDFLRWYAPHQLADGRVPCAVDRRGVDPVAEHDSHGQLVWAVVEVFRLTRDRAFLEELWPRVLRAVDAIAALRAQRTTQALRGDPRFGLLPESISHEGYASRPVHSYWDDFFAVRALADAAEAATLLGDTDQAARIGALRDAMRRDLHASIGLSMARHGIDFLPGSVELGDFDPTSSAIALDPCGEGARLPAAALARTFERYFLEFEARRRGESPAEAYTPYEVRNVTALLMLGQKQRALALLEALLGDRRPAAWCQWPEVVWRDPRAPRFLGDLPHGWVASSFLRVMRRLLVYERAEDGSLVLAAGVPEAWVRDPPGVRVRGLPTRYGRLDYVLCAEDDQRVRLALAGDLEPPPGGILVESPCERPLRAAEVDGHTHPVLEARRVHLRVLAAEVILHY